MSILFGNNGVIKEIKNTIVHPYNSTIYLSHIGKLCSDNIMHDFLKKELYVKRIGLCYQYIQSYCTDANGNWLETSKSLYNSDIEKYGYIRTTDNNHSIVIQLNTANRGLFINFNFMIFTDSGMLTINDNNIKNNTNIKSFKITFTETFNCLTKYHFYTTRMGTSYSNLVNTGTKTTIITKESTLGNGATYFGGCAHTNTAFYAKLSWSNIEINDIEYPTVLFSSLSGLQSI